MKYRNVAETQNKILFNTVLILCLITLIAWIVMKEYVVAGIYLLVITILWHTYYYTFYTILDNYLVIKWGFIKLKIKYERIKEIKKETKYCVIEFKRFKLHINPENEDEFVKEIKKKVQ